MNYNTLKHKEGTIQFKVVYYEKKKPYVFKLNKNVVSNDQ